MTGGWQDEVPGQVSGQSGVNVKTVSALIPELQEQVFSGKPAESFPVAVEPWGSFAYRPGEVVVVAAPPGMGKTAFATQTTVDAVRLNPNASCLFCNVEMSMARILERQVSRLSGVPFEDIQQRAALSKQRQLLDDAFETLKDVGERMVFMGQPFSIEHVVDAVRVVQPRILVLDYLQRITCCDGVADTRVRLNSIMNAVRCIANAGVCVVLISAVSRTKSGGGYNAKEMGMGSFRESSEVEYGADDAYLMVHEGEVNKVTGCRNVVMRHLKSRDHCQRHFRLEFDGAIQKFRLLPDRDNGNQTQHGDAVVVSPADVRRGEGQRAGQTPRASAGLMSSGFGWVDKE